MSASSSPSASASSGYGLAPSVRRARRMLGRGVQGLTWQGLLIVAGFSALYGVNPSAVGVPELARGVAAAMVVFLPTYALVVVAAGFAPRRMVARVPVLALAAAAGVALGYALAGLALTGEVRWSGGGARHATTALPVLLTSMLGIAILLLHERERAAAKSVHDEIERKLDLERRNAEARLQVLQSQIEPHFLFNSLAHVRRLCRTNAPAGRAMLRHLAHYIGAAQPALRHADIALADDADLAVAYLNIQRIRMGGRLQFTVDLPLDTHDARVPPMTLTTLVENAVKHGLSPLESGGEVTIRARARWSDVVVDVADNGRGFQSTVGTGVGLTNTRARLAMLHGTAASLGLAMNAPRGVVATLVLPRGPVASCDR